MEYLEVDRSLSESVALVFGEGPGTRILPYKVEFQFPPKVTSDSKSGDWDETSSNSVLSEPVATFKGSKARTINIKWSYIVDSVESGWTTKKIATIAQSLRGYFTRMDQSYFNNNFNFLPTVVYFRMYRNQFNFRTFRLESVDISFSENLIVPNSNDNSEQDFVVDEPEINSANPFDTVKTKNIQAFPLRTDISITLKPYIRAAFTLGQTPPPAAATGGVGGVSTPPASAPLDGKPVGLGIMDRGWF